MRPFTSALCAGLAAALLATAIASATTRAATATTIHLIQSPATSTFVDLGARGPSAGDILVLKAALRSPATGKAVGHAEGYCVLLDPRLQDYQCQIQNVLAHGTLIGTGPFTPGKPGLAAIVGSGAYAGDRGQVTITPKDARGTLDLVFRL